MRRDTEIPDPDACDAPETPTLDLTPVASVEDLVHKYGLSRMSGMLTRLIGAAPQTPEGLDLARRIRVAAATLESAIASSASGDVSSLDTVIHEYGIVGISRMVARLIGMIPAEVDLARELGVATVDLEFALSDHARAIGAA